MVTIGLVGCGAIGSSLARRIKRTFSSNARITGLYDIDGKKAQDLSLALSRNKRLAVSSLPELIRRADLIIEAASASISWSITQEVLAKGKDLVIMSVGGVLANKRQLYALAKKHKAKVYIPSGAIAGVDGLKAAALGRIRSISLITSKSPLSLRGNRYLAEKFPDLERTPRDIVIFDGVAQDAVRLFPQNINVAGVLSMAGVGATKTRVKVIASPSLKKNVHEIRIESDAGTVYTRVENVTHPDNPKTSYLAVLSALAVVQQIVEPVRIGT